jgi:hypothetical protein
LLLFKPRFGRDKYFQVVLHSSLTCQNVPALNLLSGEKSDGLFVCFSISFGYLNPTFTANPHTPTERVEIHTGLFGRIKQSSTFGYFYFFLIRQESNPIFIRHDFARTFLEMLLGVCPSNSRAKADGDGKTSSLRHDIGITQTGS